MRPSSTTDTPPVVPSPVLPGSGGLPPRSAAGMLWLLARRHPRSHLVVLFAVLGAVACAVGTQLGLKWIVDVLALGPQAAGNTLWFAFAAFACLIAADNLLWRVAGFAAHHAFPHVVADLRRLLFDHLIGHRPAAMAEQSAGRAAGRVGAAANAAFLIESQLVWHALPPFVATLLSIAAVALVAPSLALGLTVLALVLVAVLARLASRGAPLHLGYAQSASKVDGEVVDVIGHMALVHASGAREREKLRFAGIVGTERAARRESLLHLERLRLYHALAVVVLSAVIVAIALRLWQQGQATTGEVVLLATLGLTILNATRDLAVALVDLAQSVARLEEALGALLEPHAIVDAPAAAAIVPKRGAVSFQGVRYTYPDGRVGLAGIDLEVEPGTRVGLVGASGAGKSTLLSLLQRHTDPQEGRILVDGQDIRAVARDSLHAAMAVVPQDTALLHRTIGENIRFARPEATDAEVRAAAEAALCLPFLDALPDGLATEVGDRGMRLSGGQRQRIAIARAFLKDAPLLLLDEATSALDSASEAAVQEALDRLMQGRTVIAIAHRLSTLRNFERIVVMREGRIIEDGPPEALLRAGGAFRALHEAQRAGGEALAERAA